MFFPMVISDFQLCILKLYIKCIDCFKKITFFLPENRALRFNFNHAIKSTEKINYVKYNF